MFWEIFGQTVLFIIAACVVFKLYMYVVTRIVDYVDSSLFGIVYLFGSIILYVVLCLFLWIVWFNYYYVVDIMVRAA